MKKTQRTKSENFWIQLWQLLRPSHGLIKVALGLIVVMELSNFVAPFVLKVIIDKITNFDTRQIPSILWFIFLMFVSNEFNYLLFKRSKDI